MKVYEAIYNEGETEGVYALSVVENPAMQDHWITLSEHPKKVELAAVDDEKRLLLGAALIPNKRIYRNIDGNEFEMFFTEKTIEKLAHNFIKKGNQNNSSLEHEIKLDGMSVVEAWTVQDPKKDKSANYGKEYPKGTWVTMMKADNEEMWQKAKNGEIKGFSIDALLGLQQIQLNTNNMTREDFIDAFKAVFTKEKVEEAPKVEEIEVKSEVVQPDINGLKDALTEVLTQFSQDQDEKLEAFKIEFSEKLEAKNKEIEAKEEEVEKLKVELSKEPEVAPIKKGVKENVLEVKMNRPETIYDRVNRNLQNVWQ